MIFDEKEIIWAAGLFEGEGCFFFANKKNRTAVVQLATTDKDVVERFQKAVGFGKIAHPPTVGTYKPVWVWRMGSFEGFQQIVCYFWSYLGKRRRARATEILKAYINTPVKQFHLPKRPIKIGQNFVGAL